ncbi:MAG: hypothetical protein ACK4S4_04210 [Pyrinomonadaceae bacterium]
MRQIALVLGLVASLSIGAAAQEPRSAETADKNDVADAASQKGNSAAYVRPSSKQRRTRYLRSMFGPTALGKRVATSGIATWRNSPAEWGDKWEGFGRRFASSTGKSVIKNTTAFALEEAFKLDSRYYRSQKKDVGSRVGNALISSVTARNERGKRVFGFPRIVGTYTASIVAAEAWYPDRYSWKNGVRSGTMSLGLNAAFNLIKEFWKK